MKYEVYGASYDGFTNDWVNSEQLLTTITIGEGSILDLSKTELEKKGFNVEWLIDYDDGFLSDEQNQPVYFLKELI